MLEQISKNQNIPNNKETTGKTGFFEFGPEVENLKGKIEEEIREAESLIGQAKNHLKIRPDNAQMNWEKQFEVYYKTVKKIKEFFEKKATPSWIEKDIRTGADIREIKTEKADFRLIYEFHNRSHPPVILDGLDVYAREGIMVSTKKEDYSQYNFNGAFEPIKNELANRKMPIFNIDVSGEYLADKIIKNHNNSLSGEWKLLMIELATAGIAYFIFWDDLIKRFLRKIKNENGEIKKMNRRTFLKTGTLVASTLLSETNNPYDLEGKNIDDHSILSEFDRKLKRLGHSISEKIGLFELARVFRNAIMAQKVYRVSDIISAEKNKKPSIGLEIGFAHSGIEDMLKMPEQERLTIIEKIAKSTNLQIKDPRKEIAIIIRKDFDKSSQEWLKKEYFDEKLFNIFNGQKN